MDPTKVSGAEAAKKLVKSISEVVGIPLKKLATNEWKQYTIQFWLKADSKTGNVNVAEVLAKQEGMILVRERWYHRAFRKKAQ